MSGLLGAGLFSLAVILTSGFILHNSELTRSALRLSPRPIPYFRILVIGLIIWWVAPKVAFPALEWVLRFTNVSDDAWRQTILTLDFAGTHRPQTVFVGAFITRILADILFYLFFSLGACCTAFKTWQLEQKNFRDIWWTEFTRTLRTWQAKGSDIGKLICDAIGRKTLIMLTLNNRKVYIGRPFHLSLGTSEPDRWIRLIPWKSGYRDEETGQLQITTDYENALSNITTETHLMELSMSIPVHDIVTFQPFNPELYRVFRSVEFDNSFTSSPSRHS